MRRAGPRLALLACLLPPLAAAAQGPAPHGELPPGPAVLRGRVLHEGHGAPEAGVPLVLYGLSASGQAGIRTAVSDERGAFRFENLSNEHGSVYILGARYAEVPFGTRIAFAAGELEREVEILVSDPSPDASAVRGGAARLRADRGCAGLLVRETHELLNPTQRVLYVPEAERAAREPVFEVALPSGARHFAAPRAEFFGDLVERDGTVRFWGPLHPGRHEIAYAWALSAPEGAPALRVERRFARGAERVELLGPEAGGRPGGARFEPAEPLWIDGGRYHRAVAEGVEPGERLEFALGVPPPRPPAGALSLRRAQLWLELDDAALAVSESHEISLADAAPLEARDAPLLCVPVPAEAEGLRFSAGLRLDPSGALALHGPIPPGESALHLRYHLPVSGGAAQLERRFAKTLPALSVLIADTGVLAETERLHRLRPTRAADRTYMQFEGFQIEPGESVRLRLRALEPSRPLPRLAAAGLVALAALGAAALLTAPLRAPREALESAESAAAGERAAVVAAIRDLDHDFETGKLAPADHARMRAELRARAVALLRTERDGASAPPAAAPPGDDRCGACGAALSPDARFCSQCGARVRAEGAARGGSAG